MRDYQDYQDYQRYPETGMPVSTHWPVRVMLI